MSKSVKQRPLVIEGLMGPRLVLANASLQILAHQNEGWQVTATAETSPDCGILKSYGEEGYHWSALVR